MPNTLQGYVIERLAVYRFITERIRTKQAASALKLLVLYDKQ